MSLPFSSTTEMMPTVSALILATAFQSVLRLISAIIAPEISAAVKRTGTDTVMKGSAVRS